MKESPGICYRSDHQQRVPFLVHCQLGLVLLHSQMGWPELVRTAPSTAIALYCTIDMMFWLPQAEASLARNVAVVQAPLSL